MGEYIIKRLNQIKKEIQEKLKKINFDIEDFAKGLEDTPLNKKSKRLDEMINGRLSTNALTQNYNLKSQFENELQEIENYLYYNHQ